MTLLTFTSTVTRLSLRRKSKELLILRVRDLDRALGHDPRQWDVLKAWDREALVQEVLDLMTELPR